MKTLSIFLSLVLFYSLSFSQRVTFILDTLSIVHRDYQVSYSSSCCDYDNDGDIDLFVPGVASTVLDDFNCLYENIGNGIFVKVTENPIYMELNDSRGNTWGDYDNDGRIDLFLVNINQEDCLYRNVGENNFAKVGSNGINYNAEGTRSSSSWVDYDHDGFLDLFVLPGYLYHNNKDGTFSLQTNLSPSGFIGCNWADFDNDGDQDLYIPSHSHFLYRNNGNGSFSEIEMDYLGAPHMTRCGSSCGDYDNDGDLDIFVANWGTNELLINNGDGTFSGLDQGIIIEDSSTSRGSAWADFNNDGYLDLFVAVSLTDANFDREKNFLYYNNGDGTFTEETNSCVVTDSGASYGPSVGDFDNDGDIDLLVPNGWWPCNNLLYFNQGNNNNWINIQCEGTLSNTSAVGTRIQLKATINGQPMWQLREICAQTGGGQSSQSSLRAAFGLGDAAIIDSIIIDWPSPLVTIMTNVAVNQFLKIEEKQDAERNFVLNTNGMVEAGVSCISNQSFYAPASGDKVYRIDNDGSVIYTLNVNGDIKSSTTITSNHNVYITSTDNNLYSFNSNGVTSNGRWPLPLGGEGTASVAIDQNENIYVGTGNNIFQAISKEGDILWAYNVMSPVYSSAVISTSNILYLINDMGRIYAFDLNTINPENVEYLWFLDLEQGVTSSPALDDSNHIYITTLSGNLIKVRDHGNSATVIWQFEADDAIQSSPIIDDNYRVYFGCNDWHTYAVDGNDGSEIWRTRTSGQVKSTGAFNHDSGGNRRLLIGSDDGNLYSLSLQNGEIIWKYLALSPISCPVLYEQGNIYFGTHNGKVISIIDPEYVQPKQTSTGNYLLWYTFQGNNGRTGNQQDQDFFIDDGDEQRPSSFFLYANFPNPFNNRTTIPYDVQVISDVHIHIYNLNGQLIHQREFTAIPAGRHEFSWEASNLSSGIYFYQFNFVTTDGKVATLSGRCLLLK